MKKSTSILKGVFIFACGLLLTFVSAGEVFAQHSVSWRETSTKTFLSSQLSEPRVKAAVKEKASVVAEMLEAQDLRLSDLNMLIVVYKDMGTMEVHVKSKDELKYRPLVAYEICAFSGDLGPKRHEGDKQTPEGFYFLERFNARSSFYLSLKVNYPNASDLIKTDNPKSPGSAIMIHGNCVSIGCMAMTDEFIKEIYLMAIYSASNGQQRIPVYIFPFEMTQQNMERYLKLGKYSKHEGFWKNLQEGYDLFKKTHEELHISVDEEGNYEYGYEPISFERGNGLRVPFI